MVIISNGDEESRSRQGLEKIVSSDTKEISEQRRLNDLALNIVFEYVNQFGKDYPKPIGLTGDFLDKQKKDFMDKLVSIFQIFYNMEVSVVWVGELPAQKYMEDSDTKNYYIVDLKKIKNFNIL